MAMVYILAYYRTIEGVDYTIHARWMETVRLRDPVGWMFEQNRLYPIWYIVGAFFLRLGIDTANSVALATTLFAALAFCLTRKILALFLGKTYSETFVSIFTFGLSVVGCISVPWISPVAYMTTGNLWHSATTITIKPFALLIFFYFVHLFEKYRTDKRWFIPASHTVLLSLLLLLSTWAKPSFLQGFLPAAAIFLLIELIHSKGRAILFCLQAALAFIPACAWMLLQFYSTVGGGLDDRVGTIIKWVSETNYHTHFLLALLLGFTFPIFIIVAIVGKNLFKDKFVWMGVLFAFVSFLEAYGLRETGWRASHGNFTWAQVSALYCLFVICGIRFLQKAREFSSESTISKGQSLVISIAWTLFFLHALFGMVYYFSFFHMAPGDNHISTLLPGGYVNYSEG